MKARSVLVLQPGMGIASTLSGLTATELACYVLGVYESMFVGESPVYPEGKAQFIRDVLCEGYMECTEVVEWTGVDEVVELDLETIEPTPSHRLDHASFRDVSAHKLMMKKFAATLT